MNVTGRPALIDAVKRCWASTFGARVLFYRIKQGMPAEMPVAVIVQRMVSSEKSGVMFTVDPATRDASRMVIEAVWGLGEAIVQGAVTPDRHVLDKATLGVLDFERSRRRNSCSRGTTGKHATARVDLANDPRANAPVLTARELTELGKLARRAEEHYGVPQDLEFAIDGDAIYLTQSRPITTLHGQPPAPQCRDCQSARCSSTGWARARGARPARCACSRRPKKTRRCRTARFSSRSMTSPDWVPIMRRAAAIVTDAGGMTSHAAIVARELGLPCIVGAHDATRALANGRS